MPARQGKIIRDYMDDKFWLTPPSLYEQLNNEFGFVFDPCPYPRPEGFNGIAIPWGISNFVNPPFRRKDAAFGAGPTAFVRKAIAEKELGHSSVLLLPVQSYVNMLIEAGAELRSVGRVRWINASANENWEQTGFTHSKSANEWKSPVSVCCFILRGKA